MATLITNADGTMDVVHENSTFRHRAQKTGTKSILPDMVKLSISDKIKAEAEKIYVKMGQPTRKDDNRGKLVFACLHFAYAEENEIHSVKELARIMEIDSNKISKLIGRFAMSKIGYHPPQRFYSIGEYIRFLSEKINLDDHPLQMAINIGSNLTNKYPILTENQTDLVAGAIIIYTLSLIADDQVKLQKSKLLDLIICKPKKLDCMIKLITTYDN
jgi:transcription initiation factor TFIIIB Brf1 subunit/transcription initiation factor TFIIB